MCIRDRTICASVSALRSNSSRISSSVPARIASARLASIWVAPRRANSRCWDDSLTPGIFPEAGDLVVAEPAGPARSQLAQLQRAEPDAAQLANLVADRLDHAPHLVIAPLADDQLDLGTAQAPRLGRRGRPVLELHTAGQGLELASIGRFGQAGAVGLGHLVARVGQAVGQSTVVGEQDQAGRVGVETADRIQPRLSLIHISE